MSRAATPPALTKAVIAALKGEPTEEKIQTGFTILTKDNINGDGKDAVYKSSC